jgi:hypothetical protein
MIWLSWVSLWWIFPLVFPNGAHFAVLVI